MFLNINTDAAVKFTNKLEKMHKSALPAAVRETLSKAALDVKKTTMPARANTEFERRSPNFFKANSRVEFAKGYNVKSMQATVGFLPLSLTGSNNFAVRDLEQQEYGGAIKGKAFIPTDEARKAGKSTMVKPANRLSNIKNIKNTLNVSGRNEGEKFIKSAIHAGKGGLVLSEYRGKKILWRVNSMNRMKGGFKLTRLYSYEKSRSVKVNATHFMHDATLDSAKKMEAMFITEAKRQIERLTK